MPNEVWAYNPVASTRRVDVRVAWLGRKLKPNASHPQIYPDPSLAGLQVCGLSFSIQVINEQISTFPFTAFPFLLTITPTNKSCLHSVI
jgi:hypothetical protein